MQAVTIHTEYKRTASQRHKIRNSFSVDWLGNKTDVLRSARNVGMYVDEYFTLTARGSTLDVRI